MRDGDEYVVNGQKVWTTLAHVAQFGILLARTDPDAPAQEGITYFVVDMRSPGIEVRPLVQMTGTHEFNEVFFTDVRVPAANVVGAEHDGWRLAKVTLGNERVSLSGEGALWGRGPTANDVIDLVRAHGGTRDPLLRQQLARLYTEAEVLRLIRLRTLSARLRGLEPGPGGVGAQGAVRRARPARDGAGEDARGRARHARRPRSVRRARRAACGTTATSTRARSRSAAARARCSATSSARRCSACPASRLRSADSAVRGQVPLQKPTALVCIVPSAQRRSGSSCEKTPFGLSQPGHDPRVHHPHRLAA